MKKFFQELRESLAKRFWFRLWSQLCLLLVLMVPLAFLRTLGVIPSDHVLVILIMVLTFVGTLWLESSNEGKK